MHKHIKRAGTYPLTRAANFKSVAQTAKYRFMMFKASGLGLGMELARRRCGAAREDRWLSYFQPWNAMKGERDMAVAAASRRASKILVVFAIVGESVLESRFTDCQVCGLVNRLIVRWLGVFEIVQKT